jgi:glutamate formiminotransferase
MVPSLIECVPNFSEARRPAVVQAIVDAMQAVPGVHVLNVSADRDHNRTVVICVGDATAMEAGAFAGVAKAAELIDLDQHQGEHPRIGATDVVPFIPLRDATMDDCVALARRLGERVGRELGIPVYLYEAAATRPDRQNLEHLRRGQYEGLKRAIETDPERRPDFGPARLGTAGATVLGARPFLIAYTIYLNTSEVGAAEMQAVISTADAVRAPCTANVGADTAAFNAVMQAYNMPKDSAAEMTLRTAAIERALHAAAVPLQVARDAMCVLDAAVTVAEKVHTNALSDAGSAANLALASLRAAALNVRTNAAAVQNREAARVWLEDITRLEQQAVDTADTVHRLIQSRMP